MLQWCVEATCSLQSSNKKVKELEKARTNVINKHETLKVAQKMCNDWTTKVMSTMCSKLVTAL